MSITNEQYHQLPGWSPSRLARVWASSVWHASQPVAETAAIRVGTATHAILAGEPVVCLPETGGADTIPEIQAELDRLGVSYKKTSRKSELAELAREHGIVSLDELRERTRAEAPPGATVVTAAEQRYAERLAGVVATKLARVDRSWWLEAGRPEVTLRGHHAEWGLDVRCRPDRLIRTDAGLLVVSWKTRREGGASPREWARHYQYGGYACADAAYVEIVEAVTGEPCIGVVGVTVETIGIDRLEVSGPHVAACLVWESPAGGQMLAAGRRQLQQALDAIRANQHGYPDEVVNMDEVSR